MKDIRKIVLTTIASVYLSCSNPLIETGELIQSDISRSITGLSEQISRDIHYQYDAEKAKKIQSPQETSETGYGDCEDMVLLLMEECKDQLGIEAKMYNIFGFSTEGKGFVGHSIMRYDNVFYDPALRQISNNTDYTKKYMDILFTWELDYIEAMDLIEW